MTDATHDPARRSWVASANGHSEFPIQNLPLGVFSPPGAAARGGIAIGDAVFDIVAALDAGLFSGTARGAAEAAAGPTLNPLLALGAGARKALRQRVSDLLHANGAERSRLEPLVPRLLHQAAGCTLHLPAAIGDYTDFYAGIHHATNVGRLFRPDDPLLPNYKHLPVAYHGRASSVLPSGSDVRRPNGQRQPGNGSGPDFGPSRALDLELELGIWIGPGNALGEPIPIAEASAHVAGFCLLNDWSARDIQAWEYQPLGPFLAKNFCTTISPWIITAEALAPFRVPQAPRPAGDPALLPYLFEAADQASGALDIAMEVLLKTPNMPAPHRLTQVNARELYWTFAQMVAHHSSGGCNLRPGDLFGSGTISGADPSGWGSLLELTRGGREPVQLPSGESRRFLEDGDEVILHAHCRRPGWVDIGFGMCRGVVSPAAQV
jgi:fumarylacetoacetase